jgi:hypothetical protein
MGIPLGSTAAAGLTTTVAAAAALTELAASDAAVQALRQATAAGLLLLSAQVRVLVEAFAVSGAAGHPTLLVLHPCMPFDFDSMHCTSTAATVPHRHVPLCDQQHG